MLVKLLSFPVRSYWVDESRFQIDKFFLPFTSSPVPKTAPKCKWFRVFWALFLSFELLWQYFVWPTFSSSQEYWAIVGCDNQDPNHQVLLTWRSPPQRATLIIIKERKNNFFLKDRKVCWCLIHWPSCHRYDFFSFHCRHKITTSIFHCHVIFTIIVIGIVRKWQTEIASNLVNCGRVWQAFGIAIFEESRRKCKWN